MTLRELQSIFAAHVPKLIEHAILCGYEVTLGDAFRDPRVHGVSGVQAGYGAAYSNHKERLALDLNLFRDGQYLEGTEAHRFLGDWWETQHPLARWGGRFKDGNHYSFEWKGRK